MSTDESIKTFEEAAEQIITEDIASQGSSYVMADDALSALRAAALELVEKEIAAFVAPIGDANPNEHQVDARVRDRLATLCKLTHQQTMKGEKQ